MKKRLSVFLVAMLIGGLILASLSHLSMVQAESAIPKPSVPEFTVKLINSSYNVPTTYSIDPYTGKTVTHAGYHVECRTIEVKIKNQPFVPYYDASTGFNVSLYYNVRIKGHFSENWIELYNPSVGYPAQDSASEYTVLTYQGEYSSTTGMKFESSSITIMTTFPPGAQVDFQVQALIGYVHRAVLSNVTNPTGPWDVAPWIFAGETSGWSNTQTITIDANGVETPEQAQANPNVTQSGFNWIEIALFTALGVIVALAIVVIVLVRRRRGSRNAGLPLPKSNP